MAKARRIRCDVADYFRDRPIARLEVGDFGEGGCYGGPIEVTGFYVFEFCSPDCCRPAGPFECESDAIAHCESEAERAEAEFLADQAKIPGCGVLGLPTWP